MTTKLQAHNDRMTRLHKSMNEGLTGTAQPKHTPGPWGTFDGAEVFPTTGPKSHVELCRVVGPWDGSTWYDSIEAKANGHLIASAPDMLDALKRIADGQWPQSIAETEGTLAMRKVARDAIARVERRAS